MVPLAVECFVENPFVRDVLIDDLQMPGSLDKDVRLVELPDDTAIPALNVFLPDGSFGEA